MRKALLILIGAAVGVASFLIGVVTVEAAPRPQPSTLTIPDGTFGGSVVGTFTGDKKALSDMGGVLVHCYTPDLTGALGLETGFAIADDYTVTITPLAGWGTGWESGPADCTADAGYWTFPHQSKYDTTPNREWISLAADTFHVYELDAVSSATFTATARAGRVSGSIVSITPAAPTWGDQVFVDLESDAEVAWLAVDCGPIFQADYPAYGYAGEDVTVTLTANGAPVDSDCTLTYWGTTSNRAGNYRYRALDTATFHVAP